MELDLFSTPAPRVPQKAPNEPVIRIWTVGEITRTVRTLLEDKFDEVWVEGEICNFRRQASGHCYFGLKDEKALLSCVLFRSYVPAGLPLSDGMLVQARGRITVYEARGQYQLSVTLVQSAGAGLLLARFEALKRKLEAEGLFDPSRKRPIPPDPACIGIVTSPTGAAISDFLNVARRRAPWVRIVINPVRVQGVGAAPEIAAAIREFNHPVFADRIDLLVVCRGGGSMEDLWAFNEEIVARAIAASRLPVISAVGHEIDFTIADFVADLRAPTPSAAAELALPDRAAMLRHVAQARSRLQRSVDAIVADHRRRVESIRRSTIFRFPQRLLQDRAQRLDAVVAQITAGRERALRTRRERLNALLAAVMRHRPDQIMAMRRFALEAQERKLRTAMNAAMAQKRNRVAHLAGVLRVLSPDATLARGYSITTDAAGAVLRRVKAVRAGQQITTRFADGNVDSKVLA
jgi:exodeoxyribonuclease VII large subunit